VRDSNEFTVNVIKQNPFSSQNICFYGEGENVAGKFNQQVGTALPFESYVTRLTFHGTMCRVEDTKSNTSSKRL
jgi:hypothetical protein